MPKLIKLVYEKRNHRSYDLARSVVIQDRFILSLFVDGSVSQIEYSNSGIYPDSPIETIYATAIFPSLESTVACDFVTLQTRTKNTHVFVKELTINTSRVILAEPIDEEDHSKGTTIYLEGENRDADFEYIVYEVEDTLSELISQCVVSEGAGYLKNKVIDISGLSLVTLTRTSDFGDFGDVPLAEVWMKDPEGKISETQVSVVNNEDGASILKPETITYEWGFAAPVGSHLVIS